ncbi:MAG: biopolymer transporter ExbD [Planctomycetota bacterium]
MSKAHDKQEDIELNLTPMIDVVFNLIIFFMMVADLSKKDIELLKLPWSTMAKTDDGKEDLRVIINVVKGGPKWDFRQIQAWKVGDPISVRLKGQTVDWKTLPNKLLAFAERKRDLEHPMQPSEVFALIRCDRDIRWREVQWVMQACADPDVRIYKLQFATSKPANEK